MAGENDLAPPLRPDRDRGSPPPLVNHVIIEQTPFSLEVQV